MAASQFGNDCRNSFHCIIPEYLLEQIAKDSDAKVRAAAARTMELTKAMQDNRQALSQLAMLERSSFAATGGKERLIYTADNTENLRHLLVRQEGDAASGDATVDRAYDSFGHTYDFYHSVFGRDSIDGAGMPMIGTVHYGDQYGNAFWNGREMAFGDGDNVIFTDFTKSLDVIGHELSHGVVQFNGNGGLLYRSQSGALNESCADVFGVLVKQYYLNQDVQAADWLIGADIMVSAPNLRSMIDPHDGLGNSPNGTPGQPKHMDEYDNTLADQQGVHINSGIPNHAFYKFAERLGGHAWDRAGQVWYDTLTKGKLPSGLSEFGFAKPPFSTFQMFAEKSLTFANAGAEQDALAKSWAEVGIHVGVPTGSGAPGTNGQLVHKLNSIRQELDELIGSMS